MRVLPHLLVGALLVLSGCSDSPPQIVMDPRYGGGSSAMSHPQGGIWWPIHLCADVEGEVDDVTISEAKVDEFTGSRESPTFRVWWDGPGSLTSSDMPLPDGSEAAEGSSGRIRTCRGTDEEDLTTVALLLPDAGPTEPVWARGFRVSLEVDGETVLLTSNHTFGLCADVKKVSCEP